MVISWKFSSSLHSNIQHIRKQIWRNYAKIIKDFWSILGRYHVNLWISLCCKKVFMMRSPLLQQSCNKYLPFSFSPVTSCFPNTPFHKSVSAPTCALKFPIRNVYSVGDTRRRASFTSSTKAWYSLVDLGAYTWNRHDDRSNTLSFNIQIRDPRGIQSDTQSGQPGACENPHTHLSSHTISTRIEEFPFAIQIDSSRASPFGWRNFDNIEMMPLCFLNQF